MFAFLGELEETEAVRAQIVKDLELEDGEEVDEKLLPPLPEEPIPPQAHWHEGLFPYTGSRWYAAEVCEYLLENKLIPEGACRAGLKAVRHVPSAVLATHIETLDAIAEKLYFESERHMKAFQKQGVLSMIGVWNSTSQHSWKQIRSRYEVDAGNGLKHRRRMEDGSFVWTTSEQIVDLYSMAPWGRIALDVEQLRVAQAMKALRKHEEIRIVGAHVDGVFFLCHSYQAAEIYDSLEWEYRFPDSTRMFHLKDEPACKVPTWKQNDPVRSQKLDFRKHVWRVEEEGLKGKHADLTLMIDQIVEWIVEHKGALLSGPAGVGKSTLLKALLGKLKEKIRGKQIVMALRHCSAMLVQGKTIQHFLFKYRSKGGAPAPGSIVIIDEWSEVQLHTWAELARWKLVGVIFILVGDADGQRKPSFDRWQDAMQSKDIRQSRLIWDICGGLRLNLAKNRRSSGDKDLFRRFTGMYKHADANEFLPSYVARWMEEYPYDDRLGLLCEHYFVVSHKLWMAMNRLTNYHLAERHKPVLFLPAAGKLHGVTMQPQNMIIWKGMELLCCARRYIKDMPVSGAVYVVNGWDNKTVHLSLHDAYRGEKVTADDKPEAPLPNDVEDEDKPEAPLPNDVEDEEEEESDADVLEDLGEPAPAVPNRRCGSEYHLPYGLCAAMMRPQHALVYASIQGRTMRDKHIALMDLGHQHMTMRDLITATSRPTHGQFLHFVSEQQQGKLAQLCAALSDDDLRTRAATINARPESDRPDPSPIGR
ncbi:MAG: AAA family ATPase [Acidobacteria bacterium]|nr:AAA family ATPase [Acidobacteriota bacterium]